MLKMSRRLPVVMLHLATTLLQLSVTKTSSVPFAFVITRQKERWTHKRPSSFLSIQPFSNMDNSTVVFETVGATLASYTPPLPNPSSQNPADDIYRAFRKNVPVWVQHTLRDTGVLRWVVDTCAIFLTAPTVARQYHPYAWLQFWQLSISKRPPTLSRWCLDRLLLLLRPWLDRIRSSESGTDPQIPIFRRRNVSLEVLSYGSHRQQVIHYLQSPDTQTTTTTNSNSNPNPNDDTACVVFVHGGAWGSGCPALYRLVATPFLEANRSVAMIGYRTYPTAVVSEQIADLRDALDHLQLRHSSHRRQQQQRITVEEEPLSSLSSPPAPLRIILVGHSSGAHLCALGLLQGQLFQQPLLESSVQRRLDGFIGLAGVYDIPAHYRFESGRGVERISPMAPAAAAATTANGIARRFILSEWRRQSPTWLATAQTNTNSTRYNVLCNNWPPTLLCHGALDSTVPYTSSVEFFSTIERYNAQSRLHVLPNTEHAETVLHLMMGGRTRDIVMTWLEQIRKIP